MRYLGIDFGLKRIGLAITDSQQRVVLPLKTIKNTKGVEVELKKLIEERNISAVVVGLPKDMNNNPTYITEEVKRFVKKLKKRVGVPVYFQDEKLTTFEAEEKLKLLNIPFKKNKKYLDQLSAVEILKDFLNNQKRALRKKDF